MWPVLLIFPLQSWAWGYTTETPISPYFPLAEYVKLVNNYGVQTTLSTTVCWEPVAYLKWDTHREQLLHITPGCVETWSLFNSPFFHFEEKTNLSCCPVNAVPSHQWGYFRLNVANYLHLVQDGMKHKFVFRNSFLFYCYLKKKKKTLHNIVLYHIHFVDFFKSSVAALNILVYIAAHT